MLDQQVISSHRLHEPSLLEGFIGGKISIIIPAYNEAGHIIDCVSDVVRRFESLQVDYEIIVVNDGSTDGTMQILNGFSDARIKIVSYPRNEGKGHALRAGFQRATGEFTFLIDGDSEIHAIDLDHYLRALEKADIAIGSKRHPESIVQTPAMRRFLSLGYNTLERVLTGIRVSDTQAGFKAARSTSLYKIIPLLSVKKYAFDAELLAVASLFGQRIKELPVCINLGARFSLKEVFRMIVDLLGIAYRLRIRRWYQKNLIVLSRTYRPIIPW